MATIRIKLRESKINGKAGTVYYQICHRRKNRQLTTKIHLFPEQWDAAREQIILTAGNEMVLDKCGRQIENDVFLLRQVVRELESRGMVYTLDDIITMFHSFLSRITVLEYMKTQITILLENKRLGTARNYSRTLRSFALFLHGEDLLFARFTENVVMQYNVWLLKRGVRRNTLSFYMRVLRSVYNKAVRERLVEQTFPFNNVYTGVDRTRKRAVDESVIVRLQKLKLCASSALALARDLFVFSYCTRGMAFVDMAFLRWRDISNGVISYCRHKTGQYLTIRIEPCMESIIRRYERERAHSSAFVFPILFSDEPGTAYRQYQTALGYYNRQLKKLAELAGINIPLSSYVARHSWATTARNRNIPLSVISAGMGHTSERTTEIYLASLENSVIDEANQTILTMLNGAISL